VQVGNRLAAPSDAPARPLWRELRPSGSGPNVPRVRASRPAVLLVRHVSVKRECRMSAVSAARAARPRAASKTYRKFSQALGGPHALSRQVGGLAALASVGRLQALPA
jgi:hypothetical protein